MICPRCLKDGFENKSDNDSLQLVTCEECNGTYLHVQVFFFDKGFNSCIEREISNIQVKDISTD